MFDDNVDYFHQVVETHKAVVSQLSRLDDRRTSMVNWSHSDEYPLYELTARQIDTNQPI